MIGIEEQFVDGGDAESELLTLLHKTVLSPWAPRENPATWNSLPALERGTYYHTRSIRIPGTLPGPAPNGVSARSDLAAPREPVFPRYLRTLILLYVYFGREVHMLPFSLCQIVVRLNITWSVRCRLAAEQRQ